MLFHWPQNLDYGHPFVIAVYVYVALSCLFVYGLYRIRRKLKSYQRKLERQSVLLRREFKVLRTYIHGFDQAMGSLSRFFSQLPRTIYRTGLKYAQRRIGQFAQGWLNKQSFFIRLGGQRLLKECFKRLRSF